MQNGWYIVLGGIWGVYKGVHWGDAGGGGEYDMLVIVSACSV